MKEIKIENRVKETPKRQYFMVDLTIDGQKIESGDNPMSSYGFWSDLEGQTQRALYRIKNNNTIKFDFNLATMGLSEEEKERRFVNHMKQKYEDIDVDKAVQIINEQVSQIQATGPDDNHPNPFMTFPIGSQMVKNIIIKVLDEYNKK